MPESSRWLSTTWANVHPGDRIKRDTDPNDVGEVAHVNRRYAELRVEVACDDGRYIVLSVWPSNHVYVEVPDPSS